MEATTPAIELRRGRFTSPWGLGAFWTFAGVMHFVIPKQYESIMPPYVPAHKEMVQASGVAEIVGGIAAVPRSTRGFARRWLILVLVAVFPANLHMALNPDDYPQIPRWALWARLPVQLLFGWWVLRATRER
jgi:uncharacterized membrane protein